ncbi:alpha-glucosidase C-terminal domain-containing protein [Candidatus Fermentibacteria bacterium]|nr:alpha-glucosidase C-terminal domain-containing protein [Candidatus Fermentibacteria bacterium]
MADFGGPRPPGWSRNLAIYEVNLRQFTPGGTFREFEAHLPRLRDLGVGIIWLMPLHPIGEQNRKGSLGSYYSVRDYLAVNPEHGTMDEFKHLVRAIHDHGMYVIIDWVANHTAWDNPLARKHPEWFTRDAQGRFVPPVADWSDVIDLDYGVPEVWDYMIDALRFWVRETGIDGFRCDVAGMVPTEFWMRARPALDAIKPVFMLAEWDTPQMHPWFDMTYDWELHRTFNSIARGKKNAKTIAAHVMRDRRRYPRGAYRMQFTSNHDENSWNGTEFERLGEGAAAFAVLASTLPDMPLIYTGQEAGLDRRLKFFEKDTIEWSEHPMADVYRTLLLLKRDNPALYNGEAGGDFVPVKTDRDKSVVAFVRRKDPHGVFVVANLSSKPCTVCPKGKAFQGDYRDAFSGSRVTLDRKATLDLGPWEFRVFTR